MARTDCIRPRTEVAAEAGLGAEAVGGVIAAGERADAGGGSATNSATNEGT